MEQNVYPEKGLSDEEIKKRKENELKEKGHLQAAIIDLDGVITRTATQHAKAWKSMFDKYNELRRKEGKQTYSPFIKEEDYPKLIDGIPRYDGVEEFLKSRNIKLPYGSPDDKSGKETICGLGNWKNTLFHKIIKEEGVEVFEDNIEAIKNWKKQGIKTAVISSSRNCKEILEATGLENLFDARVDGIISIERNIKGKPAPDIFLEAAKDLDVKPENAMIVEDSRAGIEAGKRGNFRLVVGIKNGSNMEELMNKGADKVVENLKTIDITCKETHSAKELPSALENILELKKKLEKVTTLLFLDFDGTLTPIVENHDDAAISDEMRALIERLAAKYSISIISGRGLSDVKARVGLNNIYYAGSHGFEISGPNNFFKENDEAQKVLPVFEELEPELKNKLKEIEGVRFERKKFTLAVHYRQVAKEKEKEVLAIIEKTVQNYKDVKMGEGKKVVEIRPNLNWDKGSAVEMLIQELTTTGNDFLPVYIGDDITDEDAFKTLIGGIGILVGEHGKKSYADFHLENVEEVKEFLDQL
ncbi:MAG: trehalose-phosphatase [Bacteroidota bacterium]|nr:trehalose-phosphatase [Bacteroidota bacterium]